MPLSATPFRVGIILPPFSFGVIIIDRVVNVDWEKLPIELKVIDFKDFCIRCDEIYDLFWENFAPFFDIATYRYYLLNDVLFSTNENKQEAFAGIAWEYLMGDILKEQLYEFWTHARR